MAELSYYIVRSCDFEARVDSELFLCMIEAAEVVANNLRQHFASHSLIVLRFYAVAEFPLEDGGIEIPGAKEGSNLEDELTRRQVLQQIGRRVKRCFRTEDEVAVDGLAMVRRSYVDELARERHEYMVYKLGEGPAYVPF